MNTRRSFLKSTSWSMAVLAGAAADPLAQAPAQPGRTSPVNVPDSEIRIPRIQFGKTEISRLVVGCNPLYGYAHFNQILGSTMREWYTPEKVVEVLQRSAQLGINAFNYFHASRAPSDYERFQAAGGKMNLIAQGNVDPEILVKTLHPIAIYCHGEQVDNAYRTGRLDTIKEYCKKTRQQGVMVGVGSHIPEVLIRVEEEGWDVDFYAGCVYNRRRTPEELRRLLGGELPEMPGEVYLQDDPPRMYQFMRRTPKPCFAFKILAAGRVGSPEQAFRLAFQNIKPIDGVFVGMFPRFKDEIKENAFWTMTYGKPAA